jgi:hypothetical protein
VKAAGILLVAFGAYVLYCTWSVQLVSVGTSEGMSLTPGVGTAQGNAAGATGTKSSASPIIPTIGF